MKKRNETIQVIRSTKHAKHRILLELLYILRLTPEEIVDIRLSDLDLISGTLYISSQDRFLKMPKRLHNLIKFYLVNNQANQYLLETPKGKLHKEAAEKIIQTIMLRNISCYQTQSSEQPAAIKNHFHYANPPAFYTSFLARGFAF